MMNKKTGRKNYIIKIDHDRLYSFHAVVDVLNYLDIDISMRAFKNFSEKGRSAIKLIEK